MLDWHNVLDYIICSLFDVRGTRISFLAAIPAHAIISIAFPFMTISCYNSLMCRYSMISFMICILEIAFICFGSFLECDGRSTGLVPTDNITSILPLYLKLWYTLIYTRGSASWIPVYENSLAQYGKFLFRPILIVSGFCASLQSRSCSPGHNSNCSAVWLWGMYANTSFREICKWILHSYSQSRS